MPAIKEFMDVKDIIVLMMGGREAPSYNYAHVQEYLRSIFTYMYLLYTYMYTCIPAHIYSQQSSGGMQNCHL